MQGCGGNARSQEFDPEAGILKRCGMVPKLDDSVAESFHLRIHTISHQITTILFHAVRPMSTRAYTEGAEGGGMGTSLLYN